MTWYDDRTYWYFSISWCLDLRWKNTPWPVIWNTDRQAECTPDGRQTGRQTSHQTDGETDINDQTDRLAGRQTDRQTGRRTEVIVRRISRQTDRQTDRQVPLIPGDRVKDFGSHCESLVQLDDRPRPETNNLSIICHQDTHQSSVINLRVNHVVSSLRRDNNMAMSLDKHGL